MFSIDRWDPRLTYQTIILFFVVVDVMIEKRNSTPDDWKNFQRVGKERIND
jgi:hypothetical protein